MEERGDASKEMVNSTHLGDKGTLLPPADEPVLELRSKIVRHEGLLRFGASRPVRRARDGHDDGERLTDAEGSCC